MPIVSQKELAEICGVSKVSVHKAIKSGRCPARKVGRSVEIDTDIPAVKKYIADVAFNKTGPRRPQPPEAELPKPPPRPAPAPMQPVDYAEVLDEAEEGSPVDLKLKKLAADAALQEVKMRIASADYFKKLGAVVDLETLRQKMGKFTDILVTNLVYLPEEIADQIWMAAKASDDPPKFIREFLADKLAVVVRDAKKAAKDVAPDDDMIRKYVIIDEKSDG